MTEQTWNFSAISATNGQLKAATASIQGHLDQGRGVLNKLTALWGGSGSDAAQAILKRWDDDTTEMNAALKLLSDTVDDAHDGMQATENHVAGMFTS